MPWAPLSPCREPGCPKLGRRGRCPDHSKEFDQRRGSAASRGYNARHRRMRELVLAEEPICYLCSIELSTVADHELPFELARTEDEREELMQRSNYRGACQTCHDRKRATTDKRLYAARAAGASLAELRALLGEGGIRSSQLAGPGTVAQPSAHRREIRSEISQGFSGS